MRFRSVTYWDLTAKHPTDAGLRVARSLAVDGKKVASGKDFDEQGKPSPEVAWCSTRRRRSRWPKASRVSPFTVKSIEKRPYRSSPKPPFMTSTLQQEGGRKLNMSAQQVMRVAQGLYERGYITYMRTDQHHALGDRAERRARAGEGAVRRAVPARRSRALTRRR